MNLDEAIAVFDKSAERTRPNKQTEAWAVIRAAIALMRGRSWQPIETAPKDGVTEILAYDGRFGSTFIVIRPIDCPDDAACTDSGIACYPTHWQPLPAPPQQEAAE